MSRTEWSSKTWRKLQGACTLCGAARLVLLICCVGIGFVHSEQADRLLAGVNGSVITEGDLYVARRLNEIVYPDRTASPVSREEEIDRRIDLELIRQELKNLRLELEDESLVRAKLEPVEQRYADSGGLSRVLDRAGISEEELYSFLKLEVLIERFLDFRFRPFVRVEREEVDNYYRERFRPQLLDSGIDIPPLEEVSNEIEAILLEEKINAELDLWVENARNNARIGYFIDETFGSPEKSLDSRQGKPTGE